MGNTLVSILAGLGGMFGWGTSDFLANISADRIGHHRTFFWSQLAGTLLVAVIAAGVVRQLSFSPLLLGLIVISGIGYALGYLLFYQGFEIGNVSIVSAVINSQNVFIILIAYLFFGQRVQGLQVLGVMLLLAGVTCVSVNFSELRQFKVSVAKGVKESFLAAILFGIFFWPVNQYIVQRADWLATNFFTKLVAVGTVLFISFIQRRKLAIPQDLRKSSILVPVFSVGLLEAFGVLSVSGGLSIGNAIIISPIASALTVVTVGLAMLFLKERLSAFQGLGIFFVISGILLIGVGG